MDKNIEKEIIESLQTLIRIESVKSGPLENMPFGKGVGEALRYYLALGGKSGLKTKNYDGYAGEIILPASMPAGGETAESVAVLVHLDVVPAGEGWSSPPFSGELKDGRIYGRGAADDKGAAIVCLYALKQLLEERALLTKNVKLIAGCDEESGQACMKYYKEHAQMPRAGFSPDADFPLVNCEKTILQLKLSICADEALSALIGSLDCGGRPNVVPDYAEARLVSGEALSFKGRAAHSMVAHEGDNALHKLVKALREAAGKGKSAALDFMADRLCDTGGKALGINAEDERSGALTLNFAALKLKGQTIEITLDLRCPICVGIQNIVKVLYAHMPEGSKTEILYHQPYLYAEPGGELCRTLLKSYEKATGKRGECIISGGGTYARQLENGVAFGPLEKGANNNIHSADEFIEIERLGLMFDIYYDAIKELAK